MRNRPYAAPVREAGGRSLPRGSLRRGQALEPACRGVRRSGRHRDARPLACCSGEAPCPRRRVARGGGPCRQARRLSEPTEVLNQRARVILDLAEVVRLSGQSDRGCRERQRGAQPVRAKGEHRRDGANACAYRGTCETPEMRRAPFGALRWTFGWADRLRGPLPPPGMLLVGFLMAATSFPVAAHGERQWRPNGSLTAR